MFAARFEAAKSDWRSDETTSEATKSVDSQTLVGRCRFDHRETNALRGMAIDATSAIAREIEADLALRESAMQRSQSRQSQRTELHRAAPTRTSHASLDVTKSL